MAAVRAIDSGDPAASYPLMLPSHWARLQKSATLQTVIPELKRKIIGTIRGRRGSFGSRRAAQRAATSTATSWPSTPLVLATRQSGQCQVTRNRGGTSFASSGTVASEAGQFSTRSITEPPQWVQWIGILTEA